MMHKRLYSRGAAWNTFLISSATATTLASVGMIANPEMYGPRGEVLMVILAITSLVASLVVSNMDYSGRSQGAEANYKRIQQISVTAEALKDSPDLDGNAADALQREYEISLENSENHSTADHLRATKKSTYVTFKDWVVSTIPYLMLIAPVGIAIPLVSWVAGAK